MYRRPSVLPVTLAVLLLILGSTAAWPIENPVEKTGFNPTSIYEKFGNESIDMLSGNLNLVFPFVPSLPVPGGKLELGMKGVYNSNFWRTVTEVSWTGGSPDPTSGYRLAHFFPHDMSGDLGVGWTMNLGFLRDESVSSVTPSVEFYGPDGSKRILKQMEGSDRPLFRSTDGAYVMAHYECPDVTCSERDIFGWPFISAWTLQFRDGTTYRLDHEVRLGYPFRSWSVNGWYPTRISDAYGNAIDIEYDVPTHPQLIRRISTVVDSSVTREITFEIGDSCNATNHCTDARTGGPSPVVFAEDFETMSRLCGDPFSCQYPPDLSQPYHSLDKWTRFNGHPDLSQTDMSLVWGEWVHVHHAAEPDDHVVRGQFGFEDCAGDGGANHSLYFGRDRDPLHTGTYDLSTAITCSYDFRWITAGTPTPLGMRWGGNPVTSTDSIRSMAVSPVIPSFTDSTYPGGLPDDSFLSFKILRSVRPVGERYTANWSADEFEIWVETVDAEGDIQGKARLLTDSNLHHSIPGWRDSGGISLAAYAGEHIRLRFIFDTSDAINSPAISTLDRSHAGVFIDDIRVERGASRWTEGAGFYTAAYVTRVPGQGATPPVRTKVEFHYQKLRVEHPLISGGPSAIRLDDLFLTEVRMAPDELPTAGHDGGPIRVQFDYNTSGELSEVTYPTGAVARYTYDSFPAVSRTELPAVDSIRLDPIYNPVEIVYPPSPGTWTAPSLLPDGFMTPNGPSQFGPARAAYDRGRLFVSDTAQMYKDPENHWYFDLMHRGVAEKSLEMDGTDPPKTYHWTYKRDQASGLSLTSVGGSTLRANPRYCVVRDFELLSTEAAVPEGATPIRSRVYHYLAPVDDLSNPNDDTSMSGLIRRVESYAGNATMEDSDPDDPLYPNMLLKVTGQLLRREITTYDWTVAPPGEYRDVYPHDNVVEWGWAYHNESRDYRPRIEETEYHDDEIYETVAKSRVERVGWSDYGHFDEEQYWDNFPTGSDELRRTERTNWTPDPDNWILDKYTWKVELNRMRDWDWNIEDHCAFTDFVFNEQGDVILRTQRAAGGSATGDPPSCIRGLPPAGLTTGDVRTSYTYTPEGLVDEDRYEAKESPALSAAVARVRNEYQYGIPTRRVFITLSGEEMPWNVYRRPSVQPYMGWVLNEEGPQGIATSFQYDALGRMTQVVPPAPELPTFVDYPSTRSTIARRGNPTGETGTRVEYGFDGLGRRILERRLMPDGSYAKQIVRFDGQGRKAFESEWTADTATNPLGTIWSNFDAWDRPQTITYADHTSSTVSSPGYRRTEITYLGTRRKAITQSVGTGLGVQSSTTTTFMYNSLGRLEIVDEPGTGMAEYRYDVNGKLHLVRLSNLGANETCPAEPEEGEEDKCQDRVFTYDRTGRLRSELHPESGLTTFGAYDAFGTPTIIQTARGLNPEETETPYSIARTYDAAGRILKTEKLLSTATRYPLARYTYDEPNRGASPGMLTTVESFHGDTGLALSTRRHYYSGLNGRLSAEGTIFQNWTAGSPSAELKATYVYNDFGQLRQVGYPKDPDELRLATIVDQSYQHGLPYGLESSTRGMLVTETRYNPAGGVSLLAYGNGVNNWIEADVRNRPQSFHFRRTDLTTLYHSGTYQYDGSENITAIGNDSYRYDLLSRLTQASLIQQVPAPHTFAYTFDPWGNMTSKRLDVGVAPDPLLTPLRQMYEMPPYDTGPYPALRGYAGNRITDTGFAYDADGNLTTEPGVANEWDALNRLKSRSGTNQYYIDYRYDADNRRVWEKDFYGSRMSFILRNSQGQVLTEYGKPIEDTLEPHWSKDYIYQGDRAVTLVENVDPKALTGSYSEVVGGNVARFHWNQTADDDHYAYRLYRSDSATGLKEVEETILLPTTVDYALSSEGYFWLADIDAAGNESPHSVAFYVKPNDSTAPPAVPSMNGLQDGFTPLAVRVNWGEVTGTPAADVQGYDVYRKLQGSAYPTTPVNGTAPVRDVTYRDIVTATGTYLYKVVARDTTGNRSATWPEIVVMVNSNGGCVPGQMCGDPPPEVWAPMIPAPDDLGRLAAACSTSQGNWTSADESFVPACEEMEVGIPSGPIVVGTVDNPGWRLVFLHADHLGSVRMTSFLDGSVGSYHTYEPFGWEVPRGYISNNTHRFTGHERDEKTGLDYMLARYYGSNQARFLSVDPLASSADPAVPQSWNRYAYVRNNPVGRTDPTGMLDGGMIKKEFEISNPGGPGKFPTAGEKAVASELLSSAAGGVDAVGETLTTAGVMGAGGALLAGQPGAAAPAVTLAAVGGGLQIAADVMNAVADPSPETIRPLINDAAQVVGAGLMTVGAGFVMNPQAAAAVGAVAGAMIESVTDANTQPPAGSNGSPEGQASDPPVTPTMRPDPNEPRH